MLVCARGRIAHRDGRDECSPPDPGTDTAETRYWRISRYSNDAVVMVSLEAERIVDVNTAACELLDYSRGELLDMDPGELDTIREQFLSAMVETGVGFTDEITCLTKHNEEWATEISGAALDCVDLGIPDAVFQEAGLDYARPFGDAATVPVEECRPPTWHAPANDASRGALVRAGPGRPGGRRGGGSPPASRRRPGRAAGTP
jgi:hypothetical protein